MKKLLKTLGITFLVITVIIVILLVFIIVKSRVWAKDFTSTINEDNVVYEVKNGDFFDEKIQKYILSQEDTDFISFSPKEISQLVYNSLSDIVGDSGIRIEETYIIPSSKMWKICGLINLNSIKNLDIWICADTTKDNMQTAQLYIKNLYINGINVGNIYPNILTRVNKGLAEALFTVNENGFVGRVFDNIELQNDSLVIKGSL